MIRNHNNNSLPAPPPPWRYGASKSSESDLSTCTLPGSHLPRSAHLFRPRTYNGFLGNGSPIPSPSSVSSPGAMSLGSGGELVPVALAQTEGDRGLGFSVMAGGPDGRKTVVKRVWDRKQCHPLQPGDAVVKINGADVQSLSFDQVRLNEKTLAGPRLMGWPVTSAGGRSSHQSVTNSGGSVCCDP